MVEMMAAIELEVETDENGELRLTKEQLGNAQSHTRFRVRVEAQPPEPQWGPRWAKMRPEERLEDFDAWMHRLEERGGPGLPLEAISRDTIYD
jgi:hypothetical protein